MDKYNFEQWIALGLRRRRTLLEVAAAIMAVVVAGTFLWPPVYRSAATILVQENRAQLLISPLLDNGTAGNQPAVIANNVTEEQLNSERELLCSQYLIEQALAGMRMPGGSELGRALNLTSAAFDLPGLFYRLLHGEPVLAPRSRWAQKVARHLSATVIKRSNLIEISFTAHDPRWSQVFLKRLLDKYLEFHSSLSHDPQAAHFFQNQANQLETRLHGAEDQLRDYQTQTGISNLGEQKQALITRISGLQSDASKNTTALAAARERITVLTGLIARTPARIAKERRVVQNLALQTLKPQVLALEAQRADLLTRYQPTSERIQEIDAKLAAAQAILSHENHTEVQEESTDQNPVIVQLQTELEQARADAGARAAGQVALAQQLDGARAQLNELLDNGVKVERLQRQVSTDEEAYLSALHHGEEARVAGALNRSKILDVSVAQPPILPAAPSYPIVSLNLAAGLLLALACGLAAAFFEEQCDPRICSSAAIARASGLKTIARVRELS